MNTRPPKRRRVSPSRSNGERSTDVTGSTNGVDKAFLKNAANWSLEENYEKRARKKKKKEPKESTRLPIRMEDGVVRQAEPHPADDSDNNSDEDPFGSEDDQDEKSHDQHKQKPQKEEEEKPQLSEAEQMRIAKEELAKIALKLNENPEENPASFKALAQIGRLTKSVAVQKLCLVTQMSVYIDVIPGYQIRTFGEEAPGQMLSSDVKRLRAYEESLLVGYQHYLKELARVARLKPEVGARKARGPSLPDVAITCSCKLLSSVTHFNFREDLIRILVGKLSSRRVDASFVKCRQTFENLFHEDEEGRPSMEVVSMLSKMMKARDYRVDESVLNMFLHLRLLSEFGGKGSQDSVERPGGSRKKNEKKEFRTKRERKAMKEQKALEKDMAQADALVAHEERERMQSETLKLVFATYFRILKLRIPHLMGAVLEGLAKYAHLINQDFFGDLLEALKDLIRHSEADARAEGKDSDDEDGDDDEEDDFNVSRNPTREALLCTVTAYALLAGQDAHNAKGDLHLDLSFFTTNLFRSLFPLALSPDIEKRANSLQQQLADAVAEGDFGDKPRSGAKVNLQTTTVLLVRCLTAVLLPNYNIRSVPPLRLAAFTKQIMSSSLHVPEKSAQAMLALLHDVADNHGKKISALWNTEERKGDGRFNPLSETVEGSNPFATTVWEGELLRHHYCPKVREGVKALEKSVMM